MYEDVAEVKPLEGMRLRFADGLTGRNSFHPRISHRSVRAVEGSRLVQTSVY